MWTIKEKKNGKVLLSDGLDSKWVQNKEIQKVMNYESFRQYFMALDFKPPIF